MGCSKSKKTNEEDEALSHFKHRIQFIKQAISTRKAFFAALTTYATCLKNTGAALADGTRSFHPSSVDFLPLPPPPPPLPPPPPPAPFPLVPNTTEDDLDSEAEELPQILDFENLFATEIVVGSDSDCSTEAEDMVVVEEVQETVDLQMRMRALIKKRYAEIGRRIREPVSLKQIFLDLYHHFLKAFDSTLEVSQMLEATRLHYYYTFADNRANGHIDHSISHIISWDQSFKGTQDEDDLNTEEIENLASMLDKMLAWENKLYDQVNAGEVLKYEYQKAVSLLNKQKKQGSNLKSLVKLNTTISHLHTRYIVEIQSAVSTIAEMNHARDEQLYPRLVELADGMAKMWKTMLSQHESQAKIVYIFKSLDISQFLKETGEYHYCTIQLFGTVRDWHTQFCGIIEYQKDFIRALHNWSKLCLLPIEFNLKEKVSSPPRLQSAPIHVLLIAWKNDLEKLPDEVASNAFRNFVAVTQTIVHQQEEDLKTRERCKRIATRKELDCKSTQFCMKNGVHEELNPDNPLTDAKEESVSDIISFKRRFEEDEEACQKVREAARHKSLACLRHSLLEVFSSMSEFAKACMEMYYNLKRIEEDRHRISCMSNPIAE